MRVKATGTIMTPERFSFSRPSQFADAIAGRCQRCRQLRAKGYRPPATGAAAALSAGSLALLCLLLSPTPNFAATVTSVFGAGVGGIVTLDVGAATGVRAGMTGLVRKQVSAGDRPVVISVASFRVTTAAERSCRARLTNVNPTHPVMRGMTATFKERPAFRALPARGMPAQHRAPPIGQVRSSPPPPAPRLVAGATPKRSEPPAATDVTPSPTGDDLPKYGEYVYVDVLPEVITKVNPQYPDVAREASVDGTVMVQALVGRDGRVKDARVVKSIAMLDAAAVAAVRQWVFRPALGNNKPVAVWVAVPLKFTLR